jgi:hypothetical protein
VARLVAHLGREAIGKRLDGRPLRSHEREEQRQVVHLPECVELARASATLGTAQTVATPERATRAADAEFVVHLADARPGGSAALDALEEVARMEAS